jgi:hypothetical protein
MITAEKGPMTDAELLRQIREVCEQLDPVPDVVIDAARGAIRWLPMDAEFAELAELTSDRATASVAGGWGQRLIRFQAPRLTVEIEVRGTGDTRWLLGRLVPPGGAAEVTVQHCAGTRHTVDVDGLGWFSAEGVAPGPVSLRCRPAGSPDRPIQTSWIAI